jgi:hypothetical protein
MPKVSIEPQEVLLTSGQAATFHAIDTPRGAPVSWSLNPPSGSGTLAPPAGNTPTPSATFVAPLIVSTAQTIAVIASVNSDSASATIYLIPDAISIVPAKADLQAGQRQEFIAIVAGAAPAPASPTASGPPPGKVSWILSPPLGKVSQVEEKNATYFKALYEAPPEIPDSTKVNVTATSEASGKQATAVVNLSSPPWTGVGVQLLGGFLLLVFMLVFLMVLLWPPALPSPDTAKANRAEAEKTLDDKTSALEKAETASLQANAKLTRIQAQSKKQAQQAGAPSGSKTDENATTPEQAQAEYDAAYYARERAQQARDFAEKDLEKKRDNEEKANEPDVTTKLAGKINRELDLLWLVLLAGCLGAFLHMGQSFTDFVGNRTIKSQWAWWYYFRPFIGAGLALVFYAAMRGGFMAITTGSNAKASELNPFGLVAVAALVGMFSRAATMKLGEVFDTLFKSDKAKESKDKLNQSTQTSTQSAGSTATGGSATTK